MKDFKTKLKARYYIESSASQRLTAESAITFRITDFGKSKGSGSSPNDGAFRVEALLNGKLVGGADFYRESNGWFVFEVAVFVAYRRKGFASKIYDYVEELLGKEIRPQVLDSNVGEPTLSKDAFLLWKKRRPDLIEEILEAVTDKNRKQLAKLK